MSELRTPEKRARPIIFSGPMVCSILEGRKSQTRRIIELPRWAEPCNEDHDFELDGNPPWPHAIARKTGCLSAIECPYGEPNDMLWVRETCRAHELTDTEARQDTYGVMERLGLDTPLYGLDGVIYKADGAFREISNTRKASEAWGALSHYRGKRGATVPPIHMPRWASRITLLITQVRVERLQDITEADILAEGVTVDRVAKWCNVPWSSMPTLHHAWRVLWEHINGHGSWDANPWVWPISFERVEHARAAA